MYDPRMFKLFLRLVGVVVCLIAAYPLISVAIYLFYDLRQRMSPTALAQPFESRLLIELGIRTGIMLALGQWLLRGSPSLTNWMIREVEGQCAYCSVSLGGLSASTCPECGRLQPGRPATESQAQPKPAPVDARKPAP